MTKIMGASFLIALFVASTAQAADWDTTDKVLMGSFIALQVIDVAQTEQIRRHPEKWGESNPLYGDPPNMARVVLFKAAGTAFVYWLAKDLQTRKFLLGAVNVIQLGVVGHNFSLGVGVGF